MCQKVDAEPKPDALFFRPDTKCCTYHPFLPNYAVGALLSDSRPELEAGRERVREAIAGGLDTKPLGLAPPPTYQPTYAMGAAGFGVSRSLLCPYFDEQSAGCTVWPYREAVCSTYFCKHVDGAFGAAFWRQVKEYLEVLERVLARYALLELGFEPGPLVSPLFHEKVPLEAHELDREPAPPRIREKLWGRWSGREEALYRETHAIVRRLTPADVERLGGIDLTIRLRHIESLHAKLKERKVPERVRRNPAIRVTPDGRTHCTLVTYSQIDPTRLRREVYDLLDYFDGSPLPDVQDRIGTERGVTVSSELLLRLYRHSLLVDA
jgi:hypothetical protein